ncbi:unnamed protein product [Rotaria sp. Silwood1]|nr:unnamed protein product [Rotaria sp. Silwood1]
MYGEDVDTLNVYIQIDGERGEPVWTRSGNQGDVWSKGQYSIPSIQSSIVQIVFEGIVGKSFLGDIGLDDIMLYSSCSTVSNTSTSTPLPSITTTKSTTVAVSSCTVLISTTRSTAMKCTAWMYFSFIILLISKLLHI